MGQHCCYKNHHMYKAPVMAMGFMFAIMFSHFMLFKAILKLAVGKAHIEKAKMEEVKIDHLKVENLEVTNQKNP